MTRFVECVLYLAFSSLPVILTQLLKRRYQKLIELSETQDEEYYHHIIFINMDNFDCRQHVINRQECSDKCSYTQLETLVNFVGSAKISISFCIYMLTLKQINFELLKAHRRGVKVRVIADRGMLKTGPVRNNFLKLTENGIPYKIPSDESMMHHKFCLIDKEVDTSAKMFFGSLNLTGQGIYSNFDSIVLTNNLNIISRFSEEFEELWNRF